MSHKDRKTFQPGRIIQEFEILDLVGQGGFGDIYSVKKKDDDSGDLFAMKVEYRTSKKQALAREHTFFEQLNGSPYFPKFIKYQETKRLRFLVMELMGPSVTDVRKSLLNERYSISSALRLGIETLRALKEFHKLGFLHRDFKPSQVLIRASRSYPIALIDFGLSRSFIDKDTNEYIQPRIKPGFVGTGKYASLNAHKDKELGRRDDLFSWFYSLLEICIGKLPWPSVRDKEQIYNVKSKIDILQYCEDNELPKQFRAIYQIISSYKLKDEPNYDLIIAYLVAAMKDTKSSWNDPYEWEGMSQKLLKTISAIKLTPPAKDKPIIPQDLPIIPEDDDFPERQDEIKGGCTNCKVF